MTAIKHYMTMAAVVIFLEFASVEAVIINYLKKYYCRNIVWETISQHFEINLIFNI